MRRFDFQLAGAIQSAAKAKRAYPSTLNKQLFNLLLCAVSAAEFSFGANLSPMNGS